LKLAARHVRAAYGFYRALPPFNRWRLPPASKIRFGTYSSGREYGRYEYDGRHHIKVSRRNVRHFHALAVTMAHEIIHLKQQLDGSDDKSQHNREFVRLAKLVCRVLGFDSVGFV
jgi:hypothetical protein